MARRYPQEVHDFIRGNVAGRTTAELVEIVNARFGLDFTTSSMHAYKINHRLRSGTPCGKPRGAPSKVFPQPVVDYIRANYTGVGRKQMTERLNAEFGTSYTERQIGAFYKNHKLNSGLTGRFEKGHVPANKGKKGVCAPGIEKTQFKKGNLPGNTKPIGYERVSRDGYVEVKVKMRPSRTDCNDNFVFKHRLIWERTHGPIPPGCVVIFKDGNKRNFDPDNLALVTMAERLEMTRRGLFSTDADLTEAGIAVARVRTNTFKAKKRQKARSGKGARGANEPDRSGDLRQLGGNGHGKK